MIEQHKDFSKDWESLSPITREICQAIGPIPTGLDNFMAMFEEDSETAFKELSERELIETRTLREELEEKAEGITKERYNYLTSGQPVINVPATETERKAKDALERLRTSTKISLEGKRIRLKPEFGKFVDEQEF